MYLETGEIKEYGKRKVMCSEKTSEVSIKKVLSVLTDQKYHYPTIVAYLRKQEVEKMQLEDIAALIAKR